MKNKGDCTKACVKLELRPRILCTLQELQLTINIKNVCSNHKLNRTGNNNNNRKLNTSLVKTSQLIEIPFHQSETRLFAFLCDKSDTDSSRQQQ